MPSNLMTPTKFVETVQERAQQTREKMVDNTKLQIIPRYGGQQNCKLNGEGIRSLFKVKTATFVENLYINKVWIFLFIFGNHMLIG